MKTLRIVFAMVSFLISANASAQVKKAPVKKPVAAVKKNGKL